MRINTCFFTGHRSQKLPWGFNENDERCLNMKAELRTVVEEAIENGFDTFLSGMALGFDMICAELILELKASGKKINLYCVLPCQDQDKFWSADQKKRYADILSKSDQNIYISQYYTDTCIQDRNMFMVENSAMCIALFSGRGGGTKKTLEYAKEKGLNVVVLKP